MARIDEHGLIWSDPGDVLQVEHRLRATDYGAMLTPTGRPSILVWHLTGNRIPVGANDSAHDGTNGMAGRIAAGTAKYYAHGYLGREGKLVQVTPFTRSAIHVAGKWRGQETNRISSGIEVTNAGYAHTDGRAPGFTIDPSRNDYRPHGALLWHLLTTAQQAAILEIAPAWMTWAGAEVADCLRGHHDVDTASSHIDPGPELRAFLDGPVAAKLEGLSA